MVVNIQSLKMIVAVLMINSFSVNLTRVENICTRDNVICFVVVRLLKQLTLLRGVVVCNRGHYYN